MKLSKLILLTWGNNPGCYKNTLTTQSLTAESLKAKAEPLLLPWAESFNF